MNEGNYILIVDDDETLLPMLKEAFVSEGYQCETATSAESALELISKTPFGIMLTDISLPGMGGFELTMQAKNCMGCHTLLGNGAYYAPDLTKAWLDPF